MLPSRPRIHVLRTTTEKVVETVALLGVLALIGATLSGWKYAEGPVPTHFGPSGRPDAWGGRIDLFLLPAIAGALYVGLTVLSRFPHVFNYLVPITENNAARQYQNARSLLAWIKANMVWFFAYIEWQMGRGTEVSLEGLGIAFLPIFILVNLLIIAIHLIRMMRLR
jgi:hypothetical protein